MNGPSPIPDRRHAATGFPLPLPAGAVYCDQPYIVKTLDGAWLLVITTGNGREGEPGQHVVSARSTDRGRTWSDLIAVEPPGGPEASWAMPLVVPSGRIYVFYTYNSANMREVIADAPTKFGDWVRDGRTIKRVDTLGDLVFRYSDDHGRTWSAKRYTVPVREFECDRRNPYGGKVRFWWGVGKPILDQTSGGGSMFMGMAKVGRFGAGFMAQSEGVFIRCDNIATERDPDKLVWLTLPDGDVGLRAPEGAGDVADEHNLVALSDGSLYCTYRTVSGHPCHAYSRDRGHTWTPPAFMTFSPGGRKVRHPRAANFVWKCENGMFLYWFHNHGGRDYQGDRNPAWLAAGVERDGPDGKVIHWSQPEIAVYDDDAYIRMSYPCLVEDGGRYFITETNKAVGRAHELDADLIHGMFEQLSSEPRRAAANASENDDAVALDWSRHSDGSTPVPMPALPPFLERDNTQKDYRGRDLRAGVALELRFTLGSLEPGQVLFDSLDAQRRGICVTTTENHALRVTFGDGRCECAWSSDPGTLRAGVAQHAVITIDGGPKIVTFVIDGVLNDGGESRQFGWGRFSPHLRSVNGAERAQVGPAVHEARLYRRALRTSEAVLRHRADAQFAGSPGDDERAEDGVEQAPGPTPRSAVKSRGFTVVELLIVVSTVALLVALLLPSLKSARERTRQAKCISNVRQIAMASRAYAFDHEDVIIPRIGAATMWALDGYLTERAGLGGDFVRSEVWNCLSNPAEWRSPPNGYYRLRVSYYCNFSLGNGEGPIPYGANHDSMPFPHQGLYRYRDAKRHQLKFFWGELLHDGPSNTLSTHISWGWGDSYFWHDGKSQSVVFLDGHAAVTPKEHELWILHPVTIPQRNELMNKYWLPLEDKK